MARRRSVRSLPLPARAWRLKIAALAETRRLRSLTEKETSR